MGAICGVKIFYECMLEEDVSLRSSLERLVQAAVPSAFGGVD